MELKRAISVDQLLKKKFKTIKLEGEWAASIGEEVQPSGSWLIHGDSGNGKTTYCLMLSKVLSKHGRVAYNTIEEGARLTFQQAISRQKFTKTQRRKFVILSESIEELRIRLRKQKSPDFVLIDSLQYTFLTKKEYKELIDEFPDKLFIWISHSEGRKPRGKLAQDVEYHADVKMRVEGFKVIIKSRYGGTEDFIVNAERAATHWNEIL